MFNEVRFSKSLFVLFLLFVVNVAYCHSVTNEILHTDIISSIGPGSFRETDDLLLNTDIVRLNFSHDTHVEHASNFSRVNSWSLTHNKPVAVMADLQGPKIRLGNFANKEVHLHRGDIFTLSTDTSITGDQSRVSVDYPFLVGDVNHGDVLVIGDNLVNLKVLQAGDGDIVCEVLNDAVIGSRKGINKVGGGISAPAFTEKDKADLTMALSMGVDYVAVSFVKSAKDILDVKEQIIQQHSPARVVAKIETREAIDNLESIIGAADLVMVARGDLGIEMGIAKVPFLQKKIIQMAKSQGKKVIVATQMMSSMTTNPTPTRAEVSDIANAVYDGADMIMFSEETAVGRYPDLVVQIAREITRSAEGSAEDLAGLLHSNAR